MPLVEKSVLVGYSTVQMFDLVERVEDYPKFLPWCADAKVLTRETLPDGEERTVATLRINYRGVSQSFTTENFQRRGEYLRMTFKEGFADMLQGAVGEVLISDSGSGTVYAFADGKGEVGFISSVSQPFCGGCTRARMSSAGVLYTCLFATHGIDLRAPLRAGASDEELLGLIRGRWQAREDRYSELRGQTAPDPRKVEMHHIGG